MSSKSRRRRGGEVEVTIEALGDQGDGLGRLAGSRVAVPGALVGERHRVRVHPGRGDTLHADSIEILESVERAAPPCPHFERCGGCATQHLPETVEAAWRLDRVRRALARRGLAPEIAFAHRSPLASRRRLRLVAARHGGRLRLGYRERASHRVVDVEACPIARVELVALFAPLRRLLASLAATPREIALTAYPQGVEVVLIGGSAPALADRERLAAWADEVAAARFAWAPTPDGPVEPLTVRTPPRLDWSRLAVQPPPLAFLQATAEAEAFLQTEVARTLSGCRRVLDLFAGVGTLTAAAREAGAIVEAVEQDEAAVAALAAADPPVTVRRLDLDRRPPTATELAGFDGVVLDPPRRGAEAVARALAASAVPRLAYVSCAPVAFARDAAILTGGGFRLVAVNLVDQFRFSPALELVAGFERA